MPSFRFILLALALTQSSALWGNNHHGNTNHDNSNHGRVSMDTISALTFIQGRQTNARRVAPVSQLNCIGGDARYDSQGHVHAIQCRKTGSGFGATGNIQWKCEADLPVEYKLGQTTVSCEGYDHPNDPFVLQDSCGLEYTLHRTGASSHHNHNPGHTRYGGNSHTDSLALIKPYASLFMGVVAYAVLGSAFWPLSFVYACSGFSVWTLMFMGALYFMFSSTRWPSFSVSMFPTNSWGNGGNSHYNSHYMPSSQPHYHHGPRYGHGCGSGYGYGGSGYGYGGSGSSFMSGLGVGAAASSLFSGRPSYSRPSTYSSGYSSGSVFGSPGRSSHTSTGFGGTRNR